MKLLLVVLACLSLGLSNGENVERHYGGSYSFPIPTRAEYLRFTPLVGYSTEQSLLWTRSKPEATNRGTVYNREFLIEKLTQEDSGLYTFRTKNDWSAGKTRIYVENYEEHYNHAVGDNLEFNFALHPEVCTVIFTSSSGEQLEIVRKGQVWDDHFGYRLKFRPSIASVFSIKIEELQVEDSGVYEVRDLQNNLALRVHVEVAEPMSTWMNVGLSAGILAAVVTFCCCCVRKCCCKKSASKSTVTATGANPLPTEGPASHLQQYSAEPGPPRYSAEPRPPVNPGYAYAYQPGNPAPPRTEMYTPAPVLPYPVPAAPQTPALGGGGGGQAGAPGPGPSTNFLCSDDDLHFEMKGLSLATPLSSGSTFADVYTSDKLNMNFL